MSEELLCVEGKTVLVTGASSGFGHFFATELAKRGAKVVAGARRIEKLEKLSAQISDAGGYCLPVAMDVADRQSVVAAFDEAHQSLQQPLEVIINNAGIGSEHLFLEVTEQEWNACMDTNLKGAFNVSQEAAQRLARTKSRGSIINIASITGLRVANGIAPYCASKAGLIHLTKSMAMELARFHIRVNAIAPGYIETDINRNFFQTEGGKKLIKRIPQRKLGSIEDLLGPLLLLASDASEYMTGSVIAVDGGHLVSPL